MMTIADLQPLAKRNAVVRAGMELYGLATTPQERENALLSTITVLAESSDVLLSMAIAAEERRGPPPLVLDARALGF
jgi:hypothetical protein